MDAATHQIANNGNAWTGKDGHCVCCRIHTTGGDVMCKDNQEICFTGINVCHRHLCAREMKTIKSLEFI